MPTLRDHVLAASTRPEVRDAVARVYQDLQREIDARKPLCTASGRCCRFDEYGHRLYVTTLELAAFVAQLGDEQLCRVGIAHRLSHANDSGQTQTVGGAHPTVLEGGCPFQIDGLCSVHLIRPFGCRVFFCDATSDDWQHAQYERFHADLQRLHEQLGVPYRYLEWRQALRELGLMPDPPAEGSANAAKPLSLPQLPF